MRSSSAWKSTACCSGDMREPTGMTRVHLKRHDASASAVFVSQAVAARLLGIQGSYECDIEGALKAEQYGMAFVAARNALHAALFLYLAREEKVSGLPIDAGNQVFELLAAHDPEGPVLKEAWRLECVNPNTPDEVRSFTEQTRLFFTTLLDLDHQLLYRTLLSDSEYSRYLDLQEDLTGVFEHLGIAGITLRESRRRSERRAEVKRNLQEEVEEEVASADGSRAARTPSVSTPSAADADRADRVDASIAVRIGLTADDARALAVLLREQALQVKQEVALTDGRDERRLLLARQALCERLLSQVEAIAETATLT